MDFKRLLSESFNKPSVIPPGYILGSCFLGLGIIGLVSPSQAEIAFPVRQEEEDDVKDSAESIHPASRGYQGNMRAVVALEGLVTLVGFVDGFAVWKYGADDARPLAWSYWIWSASILAIAGGRLYFLPSSQ
ncbi:hypothetical protein PG990_009899 [Apiospora arundinis]